jgi:hypothetical protein
MSRANRLAEPARTVALACALALVWAGSICALASSASASEPEPRVILITFDGVRWNEIFEGPDPELIGDPPPPEYAGGDAGTILPYFWSEMAGVGTLLGDRRLGSEMTISNPVGISIPGYQVLFSGRVTFCLRNECGQVGRETFPERLRRELSLERDQVAAFVTDPKLCSALEQTEGSIDTRCGGRGGTLERGKKGDAATFEAALAHLREYRPRFLYIGLDRSDGTGHRGDYAEHLRTLRRYDGWLERIDRVLEELGEAGAQTRVIITTDHGRGSGDEWPDHQMTVSGTADVWLYARGPGIAQQGAIRGHRAYSHRDLRPTIERIFGLEPVSGWLYGEVIEDLFVD